MNNFNHKTTHRLIELMNAINYDMSIHIIQLTRHHCELHSGAVLVVGCRYFFCQACNVCCFT